MEMKKKGNILFTFIFCGLFSSCSHSQQAENKKVSFKDTVIGCNFKMSQMYEEKYDSFYIMPPYFIEDSIPDHIIINDELKNYCSNELRYFDDAYIILLTTDNRVKSYSYISRGDVLYFHLPYYKGISMEKTLYMSRNKDIYAE